MAYLTVNDNNLYYEEHGQGEPLVLAHGLGGNHATFYKQVATLSKAYRVIVFDHPGFGNSADVSSQGRGIFVQSLKALVDHLQLAKAVFLGQSMGGGSVIHFANQYPERVAGLIIADSLHGLVESEQVNELMNRSRLETKHLSQLERVLGNEYKQANPDGACLYQAINSFNQTDRSNLVGDYAPAPVSPEELAQQMAQVGAPVMFLAGQDDILFPIEAIRLVQEQMAGSFLVEFDACGHSAFYEKPIEFNDSVLSFMQMAGLEPTTDDALSNSAGYVKA